MSVSVGDQVKIKGTDLTGKVTWKNIEKDRHEVTVDDIWYVLPEGALEVLPKPLKAGDMVEGVEAYKALPVGALVKNHDWSSDGDLVRVKGGFIKLTDPRMVYDEDDFSDQRKLIYVPES